MTSDPDRDVLYQLLPEVYRIRDLDEGKPLQALLSVIAGQIGVSYDDVTRLYNDWFVETCDEAVLPELGELIGYRPLPDADRLRKLPRSRRFPPYLRREVGRTMWRRRRSGTAELVPRLVTEVTGWSAQLLEQHRLVAVTTDVRDGGPQPVATLSVRRSGPAANLGTPFDTARRLLDVRHGPQPVAGTQARLASALVAVWRLRPYRVVRTAAFHAGLPRGGYTFDWLGHDRPLLADPDLSLPADAGSAYRVAAPIGREELRADLQRSEPLFYGPDRSLCVWVNTADEAAFVPADRIDVADLDGWRVRAAEGRVVLDPVRGRLAAEAGNVWVSYRYGFVDDLGGGAYRRPLPSAAGALMVRSSRLRSSRRHSGSAEPATLRDLKHALDVVRQEAADAVQPPRGTADTVELLEGRHEWPQAIDCQAGRSLQLRAAQQSRVEVIVEDGAGLRLVSRGTGAQRPSVLLDGLLIRASLDLEGEFESVTLRHCTVVPNWRGDGPERPAALRCGAGVRRLTVQHSIVASIHATSGQTGLQISDSVVDGDGAAAVLAAGDDAGHGSNLLTERSTYFGDVGCRTIDATDCIFSGKCTPQEGSLTKVRFSYLPAGNAEAGTGCWPSQGSAPVPLSALLDSVRYGDSDYARLSVTAPSQVRRGASDGSEMGVYHDLYEPYRCSSLAARLADAVPADTDLDVFWAS